MQIYLISSNTSRYDDYNVVLGYKSTADEAKAAVEALKESYNKARNLHNLVQTGIIKFNTENPLPKLQKQIDYPRWPSGIDKSLITQEMRDERKAIQDKNEVENSKHSVLHMEWRKKQNESLMPIIEPFLKEPYHGATA